MSLPRPIMAITRRQSLDDRRANLAWLPPKENAAIRVKRGEAPTLHEIEARLMREAGLEMEDVPF